MNVRWPEPMPENGRLSQSEVATMTGYMYVVDPKMSCEQTLHISLFFDGTNNNDAEDNPWRDSMKQTHTNVARLFNAAIDDNDHGIFRFYIPGVGTPFPQIREDLYTTGGKALGRGFNQRCVWAYTRVLNAVYYAIASDKTSLLIPDIAEGNKRLCDAAARGDLQGFEQHVRRLGVAHKQAVDESAWPRTVKQIWINVFGFSRGAAGARAFVHKLTNEWAPGGKLGDQTGKYALPYQVNFMGLFDTVASVGLPDSTRAAINLSLFDGHSGFASNGGLAIPKEVRCCVHAFSIHEQRMSFPLDSIRKGKDYAGYCRYEIAYPGVHSDLGGGYSPGAQGKGCNEDGIGEDARKLSQIPLHDMYIAALKYGVPLIRGAAIHHTPRVAADFEIHPDTVASFNAWLTTTEPTHLNQLEDAMKFGMGQMLTWRTLRAQIKTEDYVTKQKFFSRASESALTPQKLVKAVEQALRTDPEIRKLKAGRADALGRKSLAIGSSNYPKNMPEVTAVEQEIRDIETAIRIRNEAICGEVARPNTQSGPLPNSARPGEGVCDLATNEKTDLLQGAEEMRLLLTYLHPEKRKDLQVEVTSLPAYPDRYPSDSAPLQTLAVKHDQPDGDSPRVALVDIGDIKHHTARSTLLQKYNPDDDVVAKPIRNATDFLKTQTSPEAVERLRNTAKAAIELFDNYVHDSRCWFRLPHFHEYAPGGYCCPRVVFEGKSDRVAWLGFDPLSVALNAVDSGETALA